MPRKLLLSALVMLAVLLGAATSASAEDCAYRDGAGIVRTVAEGDSVAADPASSLASRNACACPDQDYTTRVARAARLTCMDGHLLIAEPARCDCQRRSDRRFIADTKPLLIKKRNVRRITCPSGTVLTGCTVACNGNEVDVDLSPSGNSCRVDSNTRCSGSKGFLMAAICLKTR